MKINSDKKTEPERFNDVIDKLLSAPHEKVKQKLDKEKAEKKEKKRKKVTSSASRVPAES